MHVCVCDAPSGRDIHRHTGSQRRMSERLSLGHDCRADTVCFHCQQCAEKRGFADGGLREPLLPSLSCAVGEPQEEQPFFDGCGVPARGSTGDLESPVLLVTGATEPSGAKSEYGAPREAGPTTSVASGTLLGEMPTWAVRPKAPLTESMAEELLGRMLAER